jgi:hypothetical protein
MLSIKDVVSLAKAGYKPADVKELIEMSKEPEPEVKPELEPEVKPEPEPEVKPEPEEPEIDYKVKYEELLEANRKAALTRDNSGSEPQQKSAEEIVNEALIGLLS